MLALTVFGMNYCLFEQRRKAFYIYKKAFELAMSK